MKQLYLLVLFILYFFVSFGQPDPQDNNSVHFILKQAIAHKPGFLLFGRSNASMFVNMAVVETKQQRINWFTCHGRLFDSTTIDKDDYQMVVKRTVDPFTLYRKLCRRSLAEITVEKNLYRMYATKRKWPDSISKRLVLFTADANPEKATPLQKLMAVEKIEKNILLRLAYFNCTAPGSIDPGKSWILDTTLKGRLLRTKDSIVYYNIDPMASVQKIVWHRAAPDRLIVVGYRSCAMDTIRLRTGNAQQLIDQKTDAFLLYRGWLEWQWQRGIDNTIELLQAAYDRDSTLYTQATWPGQSRSQAIEALLGEMLRIQEKIQMVLSPDPQSIEASIYNRYRNEPFEMNYMPAIGIGYTYTEVRGRRQYELSNHLGNVIATVSDRRKVISTNDSTVDHYEPDIVNATDYYPFGMEMPGRTFKGASYRYGFNGKENDNEVKGEGVQQDYGMRIYDTRLGRFLSVDFIEKKYAELTPYQFASDNPARATDLDGLEANFSGAKLNREQYTDYGNNFINFIGNKEKIGANIGISAWNQTVSTVEDATNLVFSAKGRDQVVLKYGNSLMNSMALGEQWKSGKMTPSQLLHIAKDYLSDPKNVEDLGGSLLSGWVMGKLLGILAEFRLPAKSFKVDLMGGPKTTMGRGWVNFDMQATQGIKGRVEEFSKYFGSNTISEMVTNNPRASFLTEIVDALKPGGTVTVRGQMANPYFEEIWKGTAKGIEAYEIVPGSKQTGLSISGYKLSDNTPLRGKPNSMNEIVLRKK